MAKTLSFAATHFTVAFGVAYALTGDVVIGGTLALVEPAVNTVAYHFHEKIWVRIRGHARGWQGAASPPAATRPVSPPMAGVPA
ncbi:MAG TPA: DUF2061 domain-containing protein [Gammaproteobacteria bacterium]